MQLDKKTATTIFAIVLLMASVTVMAMPVSASVSYIGGGGAPVANGSIPLPAGVTPDMTVDPKLVVAARPTTVGLGQPILVNVWIEPPVSLSRYLTGYKVTLTKPDGTTDVVTLSSFQGDSTAYFEYVVDQVGTWKIDFSESGMYFPAGNYTVPLGISSIAGAGGQPYTEYFTRSFYYAPASALQQTVTVQSDMVASWPPTPLPTEYWTRPIPFENREWSQVAGDYPWWGPGCASINGYNWPADTSLTWSGTYRFTPYVTGPNSAHILWKRAGPLGVDSSGIIGGAYGTKGSTTGGGGPTIILQGRCYQTYTAVNTSSNTAITRWQCYDLRTGKVYWDRPLLPAVGTSPAESAPTYIEYSTGTESTPGASESTGLTISLVAINAATNIATYPGSAPIGGSVYYPSVTTSTPGTLVKYDPITGAMTTNITLPTPVLSNHAYYMNGYVLSVQTVNATGGPGLPGTPEMGQYRLINWTTLGTSTNFATRVMNNITWPNALFSTNSYINNDFTTGLSFEGFESNFYNLANSGNPFVCLANNLNPLAAISNWNEADNASGVRLGTTVVGTSLTTGQVLYRKVYNDLTNPAGDTAFSGSAEVADHGKLAIEMRDGTFDVFDQFSGNLLFKTSPVADAPWDSTGFGAYGIASAYGLWYHGRYAAFYAYNWTDGKLAWKFSAPAESPFESPYYNAEGAAVYPWYSGSALVADGKVYIYNAEHTTTQPVTRGWKIWCLNALTGEEIWNVTLPGAPSAIADGYLSVSATDGYQYVFGIGKSATTVTASPKTVAQGSEVLIEGTVLDQSPAQPGTPCVSKDSMKTQMEYLHRQMPIDGIWHNVTMTGVPVTLTAIGSDGSVIDIGSATTNAYYGTFSKAWAPPKQDTYTITASFAADDSYGSSSAATAVTVGPAPATSETPGTPVIPDYTMTIVGAAIAILIAVALVGVLVLRKK